MVLSLSKSLKQGMSPDHEVSRQYRRNYSVLLHQPLMILQKIQDAILLDMLLQNEEVRLLGEEYSVDLRYG